MCFHDILCWVTSQLDFSLLGSKTEELISVSGIAGAIFMYVHESGVSKEEMSILWAGAWMWLGTIALLASFPIPDECLLSQAFVTLGYGAIYLVTLLLCVWTMTLAATMATGYASERRIDRRFQKLAKRLLKRISAKENKREQDT